MEDIHTLLYVVGAGCGVSLVPATLVPSTHHDVSLVPLHDTGATRVGWRSPERKAKRRQGIALVADFQPSCKSQGPKRARPSALPLSIPGKSIIYCNLH